jgi:hypothetical protein
MKEMPCDCFQSPLKLIEEFVFTKGKKKNKNEFLPVEPVPEVAVDWVVLLLVVRKAQVVVWYCPMQMTSKQM